MSKFNDIISGISPIRQSAILHAAQISRFIEGNSFLIPDEVKCPSPIYHQDQDHELTPSKKFDVNLENEENFKFNSEQEESMAFNMIFINQSVILKNAEKQRKANLKKQLHDRHQALIDENRKRKQILQKSIDLKNQKLENDKKIFEAAENFINQEIEPTDIRIEKMHKEKSLKLKSIQFDAFSKNQIFFKDTYEKFVILLLNIDKKCSINCEEYNKKSKEITSKYEKLIKKIKQDMDIDTNEILYAKQLCSELIILENKLIADSKKLIVQNVVQTEIPEININPQNTQPSQPSQQFPAPVAPSKTVIVTEVKSVDIPDTNQKNFTANYANEISLTIYNQIMNIFNEKLEKIKPLQLDDNMKKFRTSCKKTINIAVGSICAVSPQHLQDKFDKIFNFITGNNVRSNNDVIVTDHPLGKDFCLVLLAGILVKQGDTEVSSNPKAAFPIATIIVSIWNRIPEFGNILLGHIFKESPFLVPYFIPRHKDQSQEEYLKILGYRMTNGEDKHQSFLARQTGIVRLYAAIMITSGRKIDGHQHPYGIENGWQWLCNFIKLNPLPDICATILYEFLNVAGFDLWTTYGKQFQKLLYLIQELYIKKLAQFEDRQPPKLRLEGYLQNVLKNNKIEKPSGAIAINYW